MNYEASIQYAHQRMRELAIEPSKYHFEFVQVYPKDQENNDGYFQVKAYNEIYILINPENLFGVLMLSDNSSFNSDNPHDTGAFEHTGMIHFYKINTQWSFEIIDTENFGKKANIIPIQFLRIVY
jgi:hypothetical protein